MGKVVCEYKNCYRSSFSSLCSIDNGICERIDNFEQCPILIEFLQVDKNDRKK